MAILEKSRTPMIDAGEHEVVSRLLNELAARLPGRIEPLEWLVETYGRTSDSFRMPDALAQLGDALVAAKQYDRAKQVFEQLVDREPESDSAKRKLNDVLRKMGLLVPEKSHRRSSGGASRAGTSQGSRAQSSPGLDAIRQSQWNRWPRLARLAEPPLDEDTQKFIAQSLTDVDLFASYGLTQKAIGLLEAILRRAPRHTPTLEKLLDFVLGAGDDRRTAELASHLEQIHQERGDLRSAERFGELRRRFQRAAGLTDDELTAAPAALSAVPEAAIDSAEAAPGLLALPELDVTSEPAAAEQSIEEGEIAPRAPAARHSTPERSDEISASQPAAAQEMHEVDLSDEWASLLDGSAENQVVSPAPEAPAHRAAPGQCGSPARGRGVFFRR